MSILLSLRWVKFKKKFACILCRSKLVNNIFPKAIYLGVTSNNAPINKILNFLKYNCRIEAYLQSQLLLLLIFWI